MKVTMLTTMAGPKGIVQAGRVANVTPHKARTLIAGGYAVPYKEPPPKPVETTTQPPVDENTSNPDESEKGGGEGGESGKSEDDDKTETAGQRPRGRLGRFISSLRK